MKDFYVPSVRELLDSGAGRYGNKPFIKFIKDGVVEERSFNRIREDSLAVCRYFRSISEEKMNIAVAGITSYEFIVFVTGVLLSGNTLVPFSPDTSVSEAVSLFDRSDIDIFVYDSNFDGAGDVCSALPRIRNSINIFETFEDITANYSGDSEFAPLSEYKVDPDKCAVIIYTSGTTGVRKGVMLSTKAFIGNVMYTEYCSVLNENAVALSVLPIYHCYCLSGDYIRNLKDGITVCLNGSMRELRYNLKVFQPTVIRLVPLIAETMLKLIKKEHSIHPEYSPRKCAEAVFGKNIAWLISGGAYLDPRLCEEYAHYGIHLRQGYGMTEAGCRISVPDENCSLESVGRITDICNVRIRNGEIQVKNNTLMLGYYKMPEETVKMFTEDGWLRTGDIGEVTEDGQLFVTGRLKNLIILSNGENVSPEAIEKKFTGCKGICEILVFAENDRIAAEIYPDYSYCRKNNIEDVNSFITDIVKQANYRAKPSHVITKVIVSKEPLPKTESMKIKRRNQNNEQQA